MSRRTRDLSPEQLDALRAEAYDRAAAAPGKGFAEALREVMRDAGRDPGTPGKHNQFEAAALNLPGKAPGRMASTLQLKAAGPRKSDDVHGEAARGVAGSGGALPHGERIQQLFGAHDVRGVEAHVGGRAAESSKAIGASAYTLGDRVGFAAAPDLFLAAHEAAHVVQQRQGARPAGGVGEVGDSLERQADAAAHAVVAGRSAEGILGAPSSNPAAPAVQRFTESDYANLSTADAIGRALDKGKEDDAFHLLERVGGAEEADDVLTRFQAKAVSCFNNDEMGRFCAKLVKKGGRLKRALEWMFDEGTDLQLTKATIAQCSNDDHKREVLRTMQAQFVSEFGNDAIAELVASLGADLVTKLKWMQDEGTNWASMRAAIVAETDMAKRALVFGAGLRDLFVSECNDKEMKDAVVLLGGTLVQRLNWLAAEGVDDTDWLLAHIKAAPGPEHNGVYSDAYVVQHLKKELDENQRVDLIKTCGGTPEQVLDMLGKAPISRVGEVGGANPVPAWVDACIKLRESPNDLLDLARAQPDAWAPVIRPRLYDLLRKSNDLIHPEARAQVVWKAYDNGSTFNLTAIRQIFKVMTGKEILEAGSKGGYQMRDPSLATARAWMDIIRPGGGAGPTGIPRSHVGEANVGFCFKRTNGTELDTSYFNPPAIGTDYIVIKVDVNGDFETWSPVSDGRTAGTPTMVGTNAFQNHARHEIGHAVGNGKVGNMSESGDDFAEAYGGWKSSSESAFLGAWWSDVAAPAGGSPVTVKGVTNNVTNADVKKYCDNLLDDGDQDGPVGQFAGTIQEKVTGLMGSIWAGVGLVRMLNAIGSLIQATNDPEKYRQSAFRFGGVEPSDPVQIYSTRYNNGFAKYSKAAWYAMAGNAGPGGGAAPSNGHVSWYALSSAKEMFAEMYTHRYTGGGPLAVVNGKDPNTFFNDLDREGQNDPRFKS